MENVQLRERIEILEGLLQDHSSKIEEKVSSTVKSTMEASNTMYGRRFTVQGSDVKSNYNGGNATDTETVVRRDQDPISVDDVYKELIHLRQNKRGLEQRIKQLEVQNFNITKSGFKVDKMEPSKPMFEQEHQSAEYSAD